MPAPHVTDDDTGAGFDVRLGIGALTAWLMCAIALGGGVAWAISLGVGALVIGLAALLVGRSGRVFFSVLALCAFCVALVLAPLAARLLAHQSSTLAGLANKRSAVIADVTIGGEPHLLTSAGFAGSARMVVAGQVRGVRVAGREVDADGPVLILGPAEPWQHLLSGQRVRVDARLQPPLPGDLLTATLIPEADPQLIGQPPWWQRGAASVRASLRAASAGLPRDIAGLLPGLIVGDTSNLDPVLAERFKIAGLTHLVAVSGVNELWG